MQGIDLSKYDAIQVGVKPIQGEARNQREEIINTFLDNINRDRSSSETRDYNIARYKKWLDVKKIPHTYDNAIMFKESRYFVGTMDYKAIASILFRRGYRTNHDLSIFLAKCKDSKNFSACFWSNIKK